MGGITFYLFIVLTFTGVLLMFYYHPTKVDAFRDILYLEHDVPFGEAAAQHASLGGALDGDHDLAAHVSRGADWFVQAAARVQLVRGRCAAGADAAAFVYRIICCRTISLDSGRSRSEQTWRAPLQCWVTKVRSARSWA